MVERDKDRKHPNPAFLQTRTLGSRDLADIDYDDELPTGVDHKSERPAPVGPPPKTDPNDVYYLTDRPEPRTTLPSFSDTAPGPARMEPARSDLPPVAPAARPPSASPPPAAVSPLAHSPAPPAMQASTSNLPPVQPPYPDLSPASLPLPLVAPSRKSQRPKPPAKRSKRKHVWKPVNPPPRYPASEPLAPVVPPGPDAASPGPKPVEDRVLNALGVLFVGMVVTFLAGWMFLAVTNTHASALSDFITEPDHPLPSFAVPAASSAP